MELKIAFSNEENMTKLILMSRLSAPVILKERRHFELCWCMKEKAPRLVVPCGSNFGWLEGKPKKYGANAPHLRPILASRYESHGTNHQRATTRTTGARNTSTGRASPHSSLHPRPGHRHLLRACAALRLRRFRGPACTCAA